jgi:alginate O-acetyltransferase complex protein AlgI
MGLGAFAQFFSNKFRFPKNSLPMRQSKTRGDFFLGADLLFLIFCNYPGFLRALGLRPPLPWEVVGLAFILLRLIHILVEAPRDGSLRNQVTVFRYLNYLLFFPAYLNGPIGRFDAFVDQFEGAQKLGANEAYEAITRVIVGLFKSQVMAFAISYFSISTLGDEQLSEMPIAMIALSLYAYGLWLYFSFSGATDLAIGIGGLLGVQLPENFNHPFLATNIQDFWRRWHMSLLDWVADYLYFPLLKWGRSVFPSRPILVTMVAIFVSFVFLGIWHGDGSHFLAYGIYHGLGMTVFFAFVFWRSQRPGRSPGPQRYAKIGAWLLTWNFISFGWIFFLGKEEILYRLVGGR